MAKDFHFEAFAKSYPRYESCDPNGFEADVFKMVVERSPDLVRAASLEVPPIDALKNTPLLNDRTPLDPGSLSTLVDYAIRYVLEGLGCVHACETTRVGEPRWLNARVSFYFRPAEALVLETLASSDPIVLFNCAEQQRFVDAIVSEVQGKEGEVFVWSLASGFLRCEQGGDGPLFRPAADLTLSPERVKVSVHRLSNPPPGLSMIKDIIAGGKGMPNGQVLGRNLYELQSDALTFLYLLDDDEDPLSDDELENITKVLTARKRKEAEEEEGRAAMRQKDHPALRFASALRLAIGAKIPGATFVFLDVHRELEQHGNVSENLRAIRDARLQSRGQSRPCKVVLFVQDTTVPDELLQEIRRVELPLPRRFELTAAIKTILEPYEAPSRDGKARDKQELVRHAVDAVTGLTLQQAQKIVRSLVETMSRIPIDFTEQLLEAKRHLINSEGIIEVVHSLPDHRAGGLDRLEKWLEQRRRVFTNPEEAERVGIDRRPKGILMLGISGSGKSLAGKLIARDWNLPLLRLDAGAIYDKWVGSSEGRLRRAIRIAETMAPCVLWIDEIEKGFGATNDSTGVSQRVVGSLLTWLQETHAPIFTVATANDVTKLPPELTRAGRFDSRFFLGCPGKESRKDIFAIHLSARKKNADDFDLDELARATHGFTGAEIEQVVLDALYEAFAAGEPLSREHLISCATRVKPLVAILGSSMDHLWDLIDAGRAELASSDILSRRDVATLIDPHRLTPMYCRLKAISGYERLAERAERLGSSQWDALPTICVMKTDSPDWIYAQCNFALSPGDQFAFKFLDEFSTIEQNDVFFMLCREHGVGSILFETPELEKRFRDSAYLSELAQFFTLVSKGSGGVRVNAKIRRNGAGRTARA